MCSVLLFFFYETSLVLSVMNIIQQSHQLQVRWSKDMAKHHGKEGKALVVTILSLHHSCHSFVVAEYDVAAQALSE